VLASKRDRSTVLLQHETCLASEQAAASRPAINTDLPISRRVFLR
jgi:hypothetical protein